MRDSTVVYNGTALPGAVLTFRQSQKCIVDSVNLFASNGRVIDSQTSNASARELTIRNSTIIGASTSNVTIFGVNTVELLIDSCVISGPDNAVNFTGNALGCMISNCSLFKDVRLDASNCKVVKNVFPRVSNTATIIELEAGTAFCDLQNNTVTTISLDNSDNNYIRNNHVAGAITLSNTSNQNVLYENFATSITLNAGTTNNYVANNFVDTLTNGGGATNIVTPNFVLNP